MTKQILVDSNVIVYAINTSSLKNKLARNFLKTSFKDFNLCLAQQNITESLRILTHNKFPNSWDMKQAVDQISRMSNDLEIISPNTKTIVYFFEIIKNLRIPTRQIFDAYLVATAMSNNISIIATDNVKDFNIYKEITLVNPFK